MQKESTFVLSNNMQRLDHVEKSLLIISDRSKEDSHCVQEMKFKVDSSEESNKTWTTSKINEMRTEMELDNSRDRKQLIDEIQYSIKENIRDINERLSPILTFDKNDRYIMIMKKLINDFEIEYNKQRTRDSSEFRRTIQNEISKGIKEHLGKFEQLKKNLERNNSEIDIHNQKFEEFEIKCANLQTTLMHNGLDMITELKEKLNGFIQQEKGCDTKFQDEYEKLKKEFKSKIDEINQNYSKIDKRILELKLKQEGDISNLDENYKSLLHKIKENNQMILGLRNNSMKLTSKDK